MTLLLSALSFLLCLGSTCFAQQNKEEEFSGYTGGFNTNIEVTPAAVNFIVLGDWGRNGEYHQQAVAGQMAKTAASLDAGFIVAVGDNFYPGGVQSISDPNWHYSFEEIYRAYVLHCDWYVALGNHDYKGSIQAQIDYSTVSRRWHMPAPYYSRKINLNDGKELLLVVMDTNPFIDAYYSKDDEMGKNVSVQDTAKQRRWLEQTLSDTSASIKWKIVVGHHPMYSGGKRIKSKDTDDMKRKFQSLFDRTKVAAYLCGHEHDLQVIRPAGHFTTQFLSGTGCEVRPSGSTEGTQFFASEPGFMTFSATADKIRVQVVHANGKVLYSHTLNQ
jgi:tartrate-resistant acid phosphatase type 5